MKKMIKLMSIVMALIFAVGIFNLPIVNAESVSDLVIADFSDEQTYQSVSSEARLSFSADANLNGERSCKYILNGGGTGASYTLPTEAKNFSSYDTFCFWAYNDGYNGNLTDASKKFVIVLYNSASTWQGNIAYKEIVFDWSGWKKFSFKLSDFTVNGTVDWSNITNINFRPGALNSAGVSDYWDEVYFDSFWLANTTPGHMWFDLNNDDAYSYKINGTTTNAFTKDTSITNYYDNSALYSAETGKIAVIYNNANKPIDASKSEYLNLSVYSDKNTKPDSSATDYTRFKLYFYSTDGGWYQSVLDLDWQGWKVVSIPMERITIGSGSTTVEFKDCTTVKGFRIYCEKNSQNAKAYFEKIYMSQELPSALTAGNFSVADGAQMVKAGKNAITLSFNNELCPTLNASSVEVSKNGEKITSGYIFATEGQNVKFYFENLDAAARYEITVKNVTDIYCQTMTNEKKVSFFTQGYGIPDSVIADFTKEETFLNASNTARLAFTGMAKLSDEKCARYILNGGGTGVEYTIGQDIKDFSKHDTFCFWAYNDGYNDNLTDASKKFVIVLKNSSSTWRNNIAYKEIAFDWSGWKKFNIKLSDFAVIGTFDWSNITVLNLRPATLNAVAVSDYWDEVYFDKMWLTNVQPGYVLLDLASDADYDKYKIAGTSTNAFTKNTELAYYNDNAGYLSAPLNNYAVLYNDAANLIDMTRYKYINLAVYSDKNTRPDNQATDFTRTNLYFYSTDGGWYCYSIDSNWVGWKTISIPTDKVVIGGSSTSVPFSDCQTIKGCRIACTQNSQNAKLYFDRIYLIEGNPAALCATDFSIANGVNNVTAGRKTVSLSFNNMLSPYTDLSNIEVTKNGEAVTDGFNVGSEGQQLKIFFDGFDLDSEYKISVNNIIDIYSNAITEAQEVTFRTTDKAFETTENVIFSTSAGGTGINSFAGAENVFVNYKIKNNSAHDDTIRAYVALYDADGKLININFADKEIKLGCTEEINDLSISVDNEKASQLKAFAWSLNMLPVYGAEDSIDAAE